MSIHVRPPRETAKTALAVLLALSLFPGLAGTVFAAPGKAKGPKSGDLYFQRAASYPVFLNACAEKPAEQYEACINDSSYAEILAPSEDGNTVVYIGARFGPDPEEDPEYFYGIVGFVDITDPSNPVGLGVIELPEVEPTSVAVVGDYALVAIDTSPSFVAPSGELQVIHIPTKTLVRTMQLGGQPDSIAVSPDKKYAAIAIENQRDEDFEPTDGAPPQAPGGFLVIVDIGPKAHPKNGLQVDPNNFSLRTVSLMGYADLFPNDPETEYVDINHSNIAAITLQENNHIVLVNLVSGTVIGDFSAGEVDLTQIDAIDERALISQTDSLIGIPREPDAIAWISQSLMATADEGDLDGGSRGFTIFDKDGEVVYASGNTFEHLAARIGHYPDRRSDAKGTEPEGAKADQFGSDTFLFIASERGSFVGVYKIGPGGQPALHQTLPGGMGPEGLATVPSRGLFLTSSENDARVLTFRSLISIYELQDAPPSYPTVVSADRPSGVPIPWAGLSALAADPTDPTKAYTVYDSFFNESRIFVLDMSQTPPVITGEIPLIEGGSTVDLDPEGLAVRSDGTFWLATEGAGNCNGATCPGSAIPNQLIEVDTDGTVLSRVSLPASLNLQQRSNGFEGVAVTGAVGIDEVIYVAFQRAWTAAGDADALETRIGRYDVATGEWTFAYYPLDPSETTAAGDWVGLSELTYVGSDNFIVIERDKQAGLDAFIKRLYQFSIAGVEFKPAGEAFETLSKTLVRDVLPDMAAPNGPVIEKLEGFMVLGTGDAWMVTDNDGVDDSSGETQLINLGPLVP